MAVLCTNMLLKMFFFCCSRWYEFLFLFLRNIFMCPSGKCSVAASVLPFSKVAGIRSGKPIILTLLQYSCRSIPKKCIQEKSVCRAAVLLATKRLPCTKNELSRFPQSFPTGYGCSKPNMEICRQR